MVLDKLDDGAQRLLFVLCLPFIDGVFATLLVSGAVQTFSDVVTVALTIFAGAGALAVLYSHSESTQDAINMVKLVSPFLIVGAVVVGLIAPVFEQIFVIGQLKIAAGMALVIIAGEMVGFDLSDRFAVPGIILTGLLLSVQSPSSISLSTDYFVPALSTVIVSLSMLYLACYINGDVLDLDYIRKGGSLVLFVIALTLFGFQIPSTVSLGILAFSIAAAIDYNKVIS